MNKPIIDHFTLLHINETPANATVSLLANFETLLSLHQT